MNNTSSKPKRSSPRVTNRQKIYNLLTAAGGGWVPAPALSRLSCAYTRCIHELRAGGSVIENRTEVVDGQKHGFYRLVRRNRETSAAVELWQSPVEQSSLDLDTPKPVASAWRGDPETERRRA